MVGLPVDFPQELLDIRAKEKLSLISILQELRRIVRFAQLIQGAETAEA